jgi:hypothetical protein
MSLGTLLNVAIGLILTYLLLSIVVSGIQETIAGWLGQRGKSLRATLQSLLSGVDEQGKLDDSLFRTVFGHGLIEDTSSKKLPSYVPSRNFALALIDTLTSGSQAETFSQVERTVGKLPAGAARESLIALVKQAAGDLNVLRSGIENWFNDSMDRLSGEYKRRSQLYLLLIGVVVAVFLNVDSIALVRALSRDPQAQSAMLVIAQKQQAPLENQSPEQMAAAAKQAMAVLDTLPVPIGWRDSEAKKGSERPMGELFIATFRPAQEGKSWSGEGVWAVIGWLLSGIAASLGAPYWFALLQQALGLRNAGPKPPPPPPTPKPAAGSAA